MKRLVASWLLSLLTVAAALPAHAAPGMSLSTATIKPGGQATLEVALSEVTGCAGINGKISLPQGVTVTGVIKGSALSDGFTPYSYGSTGTSGAWATFLAYSGTQTVDVAGATALTLSLQADPSTPLGSYPLQLSNTGMSNADGSVSVAHTPSNGLLTVDCEGSLKVNILPAEAVTAGAQWKVDGGEWQNSGAVASSLSRLKAHTVQFKDVTGWVKPIDQTATLQCDQTAVLTSTYSQSSIKVTAPNGGETWPLGSKYDITWAYSGNPGSTVKIELLKGLVVNRTLAASVPLGSGGVGLYSWTLPTDLAAGTDYRVRVTSTSNSSVTDTSDADFTVGGGKITVTSPNGGETWARGEIKTINWSYAGSVGANVKVDLIRSDTTTFVLPIKATWPIGTSGKGSCTWTIPTTLALGTKYRVRVTSIAKPSIGDTSDADFSVAAPKITVTSPNGGESWRAGTVNTITWSYVGSKVSVVTIQLLKSGVWVKTMTTTCPIGSNGSGSYRWTIPKTQTPSTAYKIKVTAGTLTDSSNLPFTILKPTLSLAGPDQNVPERSTVRLSGANSLGLDVGGIDTQWTQLDGPRVKLSDPKALEPTFRAPAVDESGKSLKFQFSLRADDGSVSKDSSIVNVTHVNAPPVADAGPNQKVLSSQTVALDGTRSMDPENEAITYLWEQTEGTPVSLSDAHAAQPSFTAPEVGASGQALTFRLTVVDRGGLRSQDKCIVNVAHSAEPPMAQAGEDAFVKAGSVVKLDGSNSRDGEGQILSYLWTQTAGQPVKLSDPTAAAPTFTAPTPQGAGVEELKFRLTVTDGQGLQNSTFVVVTVSGGGREVEP